MDRRTRIGTGLLALILGASTPSCTDDAEPTRVRLDVRYDDAWGLTSLEVTVAGHTQRSDAVHELVLLVPEASADVTISVLGLRGDTAYARGTLDVVPAHGEEVRATVRLDRIAFADGGTRGDGGASGTTDGGVVGMDGGPVRSDAATGRDAGLDAGSGEDGGAGDDAGSREDGGAMPDGGSCDTDWRVSFLDRARHRFTDIALGVDSVGQAHAVFHDLNDGILLWANLVPGGDWTATPLDSVSPTGFGTSLAIDDLDGVNVTYRDARHDIVHRRKTPSASIWGIQVVGSGSDRADPTAIAIGRRAHAAYRDGGDNAIYQNDRTLTLWETSRPIPGTEGAGAELSIAATEEEVVVAFEGNDQTSLRLATRVDGEWTVRTLATVGFYLHGTTIPVVADDTGGFHLAVYGTSPARLRYFSRPADGEWSEETVPGVGGPGDYASLALDASGRPHIAYHDREAGALAYATRRGSEWSVETVHDPEDPDVDVGGYAAIGAAPDGTIHIAYARGDRGLGLARREPCEAE